MSVRGNKNIGVPTVLLHEGEGLVLTVETQSGHAYRGTCVTTEDNMNLSLKDVTATDPKGNVAKMDRVFIRGSQLLMIVFPDAMAKAPFFTRVALAAKGVSFAGGLGRGRQAAIGAKGERAGGGVAGVSLGRAGTHPLWPALLAHRAPRSLLSSPLSLGCSRQAGRATAVSAGRAAAAAAGLHGRPAAAGHDADDGAAAAGVAPRHGPAARHVSARRAAAAGVAPRHGPAARHVSARRAAAAGVPRGTVPAGPRRVWAGRRRRRRGAARQRHSARRRRAAAARRRRERRRDDAARVAAGVAAGTRTAAA
jgi:small nuclear ribonucleoprotein D3